LKYFTNFVDRYEITELGIFGLIHEIREGLPRKDERMAPQTFLNFNEIHQVLSNSRFRHDKRSTMDTLRQLRGRLGLPGYSKAVL
jgi:hypothetical protein